MKVTETRAVGTGYDEYAGKGSIGVMIEDAAVKRTNVTICAGEPEDAVFYRDLDGAYGIAELVKAAYEAGKRGEPYEYEFVDENAEDAD